MGCIRLPFSLIFRISRGKKQKKSFEKIVNTQKKSFERIRVCMIFFRFSQITNTSVKISYDVCSTKKSPALDKVVCMFCLVMVNNLFHGFSHSYKRSGFLPEFR